MADKFDQPQKVSDLLIVFPGAIDHLLPDWNDIPEDFRRGNGEARPWLKLQSDWFYQGIPANALATKEGVDPDTAIRHVKCIQGSFSPKHEHKQAAVAWLMSRWFELGTG